MGASLWVLHFVVQAVVGVSSFTSACTFWICFDCLRFPYAYKPDSGQLLEMRTTAQFHPDSAYLHPSQSLAVTA